MDRLKGKVAVIIGAGQSPGELLGNGRATTIRFAQEGASLLAVDRNVESARESLAMAGAGIDGEAFEADTAKTVTVKAAIDAAMRRWGRIDILHYNVGVSVAAGPQSIDDITDEVFDLTHAINLRGAVMAAKFVQPIMRQQRSGVLINISSIAVYETNTPSIAYRTSKAGMLAFTRQFAMINAEYGIRANCILPGYMATSMAVETRMRMTGRSREDILAERDRQVPLRRKGGSAWDVANAALFLASDEASFITGVELPVDGGSLAKIG
jgi:NAD(P)-dependent dehydrogenase (short-subunit alcohol dehydrogenase family)